MFPFYLFINCFFFILVRSVNIFVLLASIHVCVRKSGSLTHSQLPEYFFMIRQSLSLCVRKSGPLSHFQPPDYLFMNSACVYVLRNLAMALSLTSSLLTTCSWTVCMCVRVLGNLALARRRIPSCLLKPTWSTWSACCWWCSCGWWFTCSPTPVTGATHCQKMRSSSEIPSWTEKCIRASRIIRDWPLTSTGFTSG